MFPFSNILTYLSFDRMTIGIINDSNMHTITLNMNTISHFNLLINLLIITTVLIHTLLKRINLFIHSFIQSYCYESVTTLWVQQLIEYVPFSLFQPINAPQKSKGSSFCSSSCCVKGNIKNYPDAKHMIIFLIWQY